MFETELPKSADIVVVGSGVMGASVAFQLTRNDAGKVLLNRCASPSEGGYTPDIRPGADTLLDDGADQSC